MEKQPDKKPLAIRISERICCSRYTTAVLLVIILTGFDLITKDLSSTYWRGEGTMTLFEPFCHLEYARNYESTFRLGSLVSDENKQILFSVGSILVMSLLSWTAVRHQVSRVGLVGIACIVSGLIGNTGDRIVLGYVVDFIHLHAGGYDFPVFNLADVYVYSGFALLLLEVFRHSWNRKHSFI